MMDVLDILALRAGLFIPHLMHYPPELSEEEEEALIRNGIKVFFAVGKAFYGVLRLEDALREVGDVEVVDLGVEVEEPQRLVLRGQRGWKAEKLYVVRRGDVEVVAGIKYGNGAVHFASLLPPVATDIARYVNRDDVTADEIVFYSVILPVLEDAGTPGAVVARGGAGYSSFAGGSAELVRKLLASLAERGKTIVELKARVEELEERLREYREERASRMIRDLMRFFADERMRVAFPGWSAGTYRGDVALVYGPVPVRFVVKGGSIYRAGENSYGVERIIVYVKNDKSFGVVAEGRHPNVDPDTGEVCLGSLSHLARLSVPNLFALLVRLPAMLSTANLDSAYFDANIPVVGEGRDVSALVVTAGTG